MQNINQQHSYSVDMSTHTTIAIPLDTREPIIADTPVNFVRKKYFTALVGMAKSHGFGNEQNHRTASHGFGARLAGPEGEPVPPRLGHDFGAVADSLNSNVHNVRNLAFASQQCNNSLIE